MSYDLVVGSGHDDESQHDLIWNASSGLATWVLEQIHDRVADTGLKDALRQLMDGRYSYFPLTVFTEAQVAQVLAVILGPLLPAARDEWTPDNDLHNTPQAIEELVAETQAMLSAVNAQRRKEGRRELRPADIGHNGAIVGDDPAGV